MTFLPSREFSAYWTMFTKKVHFLVTVIPYCGFLKVSSDEVGTPNEFSSVNFASIVGHSSHDY